MSFLIYRQRSDKSQNKDRDLIHDGKAENNVEITVYTETDGTQIKGFKNGLTNADVDNNFYTLNIEKLDKLTLPDQSVNSSVYFKQHVNTNTLNIKNPTFTINDSQNILSTTADQGIIFKSAPIRFDQNSSVLSTTNINNVLYLTINIPYTAEYEYIGNNITKTVRSYIGNSLQISSTENNKNVSGLWKITAINIVNNNIIFTTSCIPSGEIRPYNNDSNNFEILYIENQFLGYESNTKQLTYLIQSNINSDNRVNGTKGVINAYVENDNIINKPAYWARSFAFMG